MINEFLGEYRWLSNFFMAGLKYEGIVYPSSEHAYQAGKFNSDIKRQQIANLETPSQAKKAGEDPEGKLLDWHDRRLIVMEEVLKEKFKRPELSERLIATGNQELIEGNYWHDEFWGVCSCKTCGAKGLNHLGRLLMKIRKELYESRRQADQTAHRPFA